MNYQRILRITNCYFCLTGYQIRCYDQKSQHYRLTIVGVLNFLILFVLYLICFGHHFEKSEILKMVLDMSPFLRNLVRIQVVVGLKAFLFCIIEWRSLTRILNGLAEILNGESLNSEDKSWGRYEIFTYFMFFATLLVALMFGLYIAIELKFKLPPLDHIMIGMALFVPHLMLAGCLRLYSLGLWLLKQELDGLKVTLKDEDSKNMESSPTIIIEIINPVLNQNLSSEKELQGIYRESLQRLKTMADFCKHFDSNLQKQLCLLVGLNFNALLFAIYSKLYFENIWHVIFTDRNRRIFYAGNSAIFVCILLDYIILLLSQHNFRKEKQNILDQVNRKLFGQNMLLAEMQSILGNIKHILTQQFNLKLFGLIDFNAWNFLMVQGLMLSVIAIIVTYQYLNDQIMALVLRLDSNDSDLD